MKKTLLVLVSLLFLCSTACATYNYTTLEWPGSVFFNFSTGRTVSLSSGENNAFDPTTNEPKYDIALEPWVMPGWCANRIEMGQSSLDSFGDPPATGYKDDELSGYDCYEVKTGNAYWIKTRDGKYAKVRITGAQFLGSDPEVGNKNRISFEWELIGGTGSGLWGTGNSGQTAGTEGEFVLGTLLGAMDFAFIVIIGIIILVVALVVFLTLGKKKKTPVTPAAPVAPAAPATPAAQKPKTPPAVQAKPSRSEALKLLRQRYAKGEISSEEFKEMQKELGG